MKRLSQIVAASALLAVLLAAPAFAQTPIVCQTTRTVAAGDWLSKIAATAYGDASLTFPIFSATNSQAITDTSFHFIDNPNELEIGWQLCIPAKPAASAGLSQAQLANASYKSDFGTDGVAKLTDGKFSASAAPDTPLLNNVTLVDEIAFGEVNGAPIAALVLVENGGGSGVFSTLHLVRAKDGQPSDTASVTLGDRVNVTSLNVQDNNIVVGMTTQGPNEAMCCGTQRVLNTYALNGDKLDQASTQVVGNVDQGTPTTPSTPTAAPQLTGPVWKWTGTLMNDAKSTPTDPNQYLLQFRTDGTVSIQADCNSVGGTYTTNGNQLTITLGPSTLVACPPASLGDLYVQQLSNVGSYLFDGDKLVLEIKLDSGSMTFEQSAPAGLAGTSWDVTSYNNGNEAVVSLILDTAITLDFAADRVSGTAGCNNYSGGYNASGETLTVGALASTFKLCHKPDGIMEQEGSYLAALQQAATYDIRGEVLTIRDGKGATQVVAQRRAPASLAGISWDVTGVNNGKQALASLAIGTQISLDFGTDGNVSGVAGCNNYSGGYESTATTLKVGPLISTEKFCTEPEGVMDQEAQFLTALQNSATYEISGNSLTIRDAEGAMQVTAIKK